MARAHRELITIEFKHNTDHYSEYQITEHEAESLLFALQEVLDIEWGAGEEYVTSDVKCKSHPDAPHGYNRDLSHAEGRYVCECEHWEPDEYEYATVGDVRQCPETLKVEMYGEDGWKELYGEPNTYDWKQEYSHMYWTLKDLLKRSKGATDITKVVNELEKIHATFPNPTKV